MFEENAELLNRLFFLVRLFDCNFIKPFFNVYLVRLLPQICIGCYNCDGLEALARDFCQGLWKTDLQCFVVWRNRKRLFLEIHFSSFCLILSFLAFRTQNHFCQRAPQDPKKELKHANKGQSLNDVTQV